MRIITLKLITNAPRSLWKCAHKRLLCSTVGESQEDADYADLAKKFLPRELSVNRILLIQPRIKWGLGKVKQSDIHLHIDEAVALVQSLPNWKVVKEMNVTLQGSLKKSHLVGRGKYDELIELVQADPSINAIFLNVDIMTTEQHSMLSGAWQLPIFDRYNLVLNIFRTYAKTKEAKLQLALAEIPYLKTRLRALHDGDVNQSLVGGFRHTGTVGETFWQKRKRLLQDREVKLKRAIDDIREQRKVARETRLDRKRFPLVAVVGYTNAGKTSLIRAMTQDPSLIPEDRLFATLDVSTHIGTLPSKMTVMYTDTVGFISNIPTDLIASFSATLEDIKSADLIVHVRDISHPDAIQQKETVLKTLKQLRLSQTLLDNIVEVCNKVDKCQTDHLSENLKDCQGVAVSCTNYTGITELAEMLQTKLISTTGLKPVVFKVPMSGDHLGILYKETTVAKTVPNAGGTELYVETLINDVTLKRLSKRFGSSCKILIKQQLNGL